MLCVECLIKTNESKFKAVPEQKFWLREKCESITSHCKARQAIDQNAPELHNFRLQFSISSKFADMHVNTNLKKFW